MVNSERRVRAEEDEQGERRSGPALGPLGHFCGMSRPRSNSGHKREVGGR